MHVYRFHTERGGEGGGLGKIKFLYETMSYTCTYGDNTIVINYIIIIIDRVFKL